MTTSTLHAPVSREADPISTAIDSLARVVNSQGSGDENYFRNQLPRYTRTMARIQQLRPQPCRVLDIGSHYLHQSILLSRLGHRVSGIDIQLFSGAAFVQERARQFDIRNSTVDALEAGEFLRDEDGTYDLIVFTEILEHITFNPIRFWRRVYELLSPTGMVYLSTPNALRPAAWWRGLHGLIAFRGMGLSVDDIMADVTYGHHWKEYSTWEIRKYFAMLSRDFDVNTDWYSSDLGNAAGLRTTLKKLLAVVPCFRSDIEAVIRRTGEAGFTARPPELRMQISTPAIGDEPSTRP